MKLSGGWVPLYLISIFEEPETTVYERLIDYALAKSDAFMLVTSRHYSDLKDFEFTINKQDDFENEMQYQDYLNSFENFKKKIFLDAQIFEESTKPFLQKLQPYLVKERHKPEEWPSTKCGENNSDKIHFDINVYKVCKQVRRYLLEPKGLFHWIHPYFPEDLCFFKDGFCWISTSAHERKAEIYTKEEDDTKVLKNLGLKFKSEKKETRMFHEEY